MSLSPKKSKRPQSVPRMESHLDLGTALCLMCVQVFRYRSWQRCWKFWTRLIRTNYVSSSATRWPLELQASSRSMFKYPSVVGYMPLKRCSASSESGRCSRVKGGWYLPTSVVRVCLFTISQLTTFGPWKCVDLIPHTSGRCLVTRPTPP